MNETIDLNDKVSVVLTKYGAEVLNANNEEMENKCPSIARKTDYKEGDIYEDQLWSVLGDFEGCFYIGHKMVFNQLKKVKTL